MLYVSDFFSRNREAVSNQIELLVKKRQSKLIAATRFMGQKPMRRQDRRDGIYIVPAFMYPVALALALLTSRAPVHTFEEESFPWKRFLFNMSRRPLYVSLYRRPEAEHVKYLHSYRHLKGIFVELDAHKTTLVEAGFEPDKIGLTPTPAKLQRRKSNKKYDPKSINLAFASWNNSEENALHNRGLIYLLDLLAKNPELSLTIALRDSDTEEFIQEAKSRGIEKRIKLITIQNINDLKRLFDEADFVAFVAQERVVKDVPNSIIDGLSFGKPVIISDVLDFWTIVDKHKIGLVVKKQEPAGRFYVSPRQYAVMSQRAYDYSAKHTHVAYRKASTAYKEPSA